MREAAHAMARPDAAESIGEQLWLLARQHGLLSSSSVTRGTDQAGAQS
jgi:hypothetical protein